MAGTGERGALMEDWMLPSPSPRTTMTSFLNEEFSSGPFFDLFSENGSNKPQDGSEKSKTFMDLSEEEPAHAAKAPFQKDISLEPNLFGANQKLSSHSGLAERMAARAGFSVPKIDTSRVGSSAVIRSPVTIPPGLSPTAFLESPVFLSNAMVQPSPTTGKLPFFMPTNANLMIPLAPKKAEDHLLDDSTFSFQPLLRSKLPSFSAAEKDCNAVHQNQSSANVNQQEFSLQSTFTEVKDITEGAMVTPKTSDSMLASDHPSPADEQDGKTNQNGEYPSVAVGAPAEDGYNWRKYGQKQVKNSEHPRSYYKCTHPNCSVKKKVERSEDGQITEIIYKGTHNHPMPPPNRRSSVLFAHLNDPQVDGSDNLGSQPGHNPASLWGSAPNGCFHGIQSEGLETKPSASLTEAEFCDNSVRESQDAIDISSTLSNEEDDRATHGTISLDCDGEEDETESKRRKLDASTTTTTTASTIDMGAAASRAVREPRVVVQTTSEVDILDDGYRWRKYGQKVVKGNPNPRSYYKCTHPGCSVRKHVERASHDLKSVITTYEGKHNHEVPSARNNGHPGSGSGSALLAAPQTISLHRRPEPAHGSFTPFGGVAAAYNPIGLPSGDQLGPPAGGFYFGMVPPGMVLPMPSLGHVAPASMSSHPPTMQGVPGPAMPRGQLKTEPASESGFTLASRASSAYQQRMSRMPLGPQM